MVGMSPQISLNYVLPAFNKNTRNVDTNTIIKNLENKMLFFNSEYAHLIGVMSPQISLNYTIIKYTTLIQS